MAYPNLITPADLYRNQVLTRYAGSLADPYGLSKAIGSVGAGYGDMNREVQAGAQSYDTLQKSLAGEAAGLPGLQADQAAAQSRLATNTSTDALKTQQAIEAAFQAAIAAKKVPGTPEFNDFMLSHVNTYGAAAKITPDVARGNLLRQTQDVQTKAMKAAIDKSIRNEVIKQHIAQEKNNTFTAADINGVPRQEAIKSMLEYANKLADQAVERIGAQVFVDPNTGFIKAVDISGKPFEIPPEVLAAGYAMGGNKTPYGVFEQLTKDQQAAIRQQNLNQRTAGLLQHYQTEQDKAMKPPAAPPKEVLDPYTKERTARFHKIEAAYFRALDNSAKEGGTPVPKETKDLYERELAWYESTIHRNNTPQSTVITGNDFAGTPAAPTSYDYGIPAGPEYAGTPEAVEQMPPETPALPERFGNFLNSINPFSTGFSPNYGIPPLPE